MRPYESKLNSLLSEFQHHKRLVSEEKKILRELEERETDTTQAQKLIQMIAETVQKSAHSQIAAVVTKCLQAIFGNDSYEFKIIFERKRGKTEAKLVLEKDGLVLDDPTNEAGGGCLDVAALALRLACLVLSRPRLRKIIVADEPMKNVNGEIYQERMGTMLETLAEDFGIQFILVSDDSWLHIGKVIAL